MTKAAKPGAKRESGMGPTFAIAFGGGGARGLSHIHAIEALDELGIRPTAISGSSIGAIMGAGMAAGMSGAEIRDFTRSVFGNRTELAARVWRARPGSFAEMLERGRRIAQFNIERILGAFLPEAIPNDFAELKIPLAVTATDFYGHCLHVMEEGDLRSALAASAAIPAMFRPVMRNDIVLVDGGFFNPVPFDLVQPRADITIAIDVVGAPEKGKHPMPGTLDLMFGSSQLIMQAVTAHKLERVQPQIFLRPPVSQFRVLDFLKIDTVLDETASLKDDLKREIDRAVETFEKGSWKR